MEIVILNIPAEILYTCHTSRLWYGFYVENILPFNFSLKLCEHVFLSLTHQKDILSPK